MSRRKKRSGFSYVVVAILSAAAALFAAGVFDDSSSVTTDMGADDTPVYVASGEYTSYFAQLNADEQKIYNTLLKGIPDGKSSYTFKNVDYKAYPDYCWRAMCALTNDHPELFWVNGGYTIRKSHVRFEETGTIEIELDYYDYWQYIADPDKKIRELEDAVTRVADMAREYATDFEKIWFVHDYLVENAIYDHDGLDEYYNTMHDASCEYIFSAYGCLVNGKTVCSGYAKAFQLIMQELGYDCMYVTGDAGEAHGWNCIFVEDEGYFIDVTWDDPDYEHDEATYEYFCITGEMLAKTHKLDADFEVPACTATEYNYFVYRDFVLDSYDFEKICEIAAQQADRHIISLKFSSLELLSDAYDRLIGGGGCYDIPTFEDLDGISYSVNEDHYTLTFYLD